MMESLRIVERGEATPQDVDVAMKLGAGFPMGPFELADVCVFDFFFFLNMVLALSCAFCFFPQTNPAAYMFFSLLLPVTD